jgi:hypothetical protein
MLRAYNAEADNCVRSLRSGNVSTAKRRLDASVIAIEKLGAMMEMRVNADYHRLRVQELELTADFQMKVQEERERAREERELLREQRRVEQELAAERERLDKERAHYASALATLRAKGDDVAADELQQRLTQIDEAIEANDYRAPTSAPVRVRDLQPRHVRSQHRQDRHDSSARAARPCPGTRRRIRAVPVRRSCAVLL